MTEPISDEELAELRGWVTDWSFVYPRPEIRALLARLDDAEARAEKFSYSAEDVRLLIAEAEAERDAAVAELKAEIEDANELVELFKMALSERDAALASSPEGVVTLPKLGQRVRITTDDGMDHVGEVIRYGDPEEPAPELSGSAAGPMRRPATVIRPGEGLDEHGRHVRLEATGDTEIVNLGGHGEQIGTWDPVESPLYRLVRPEDTKGGDNE